MAPDLQTIRLSSLSKVFPDEELRAKPFTKASMLRGEVFAFQVAYRSKSLRKNIRVGVKGAFPGEVIVRYVGLSPSELPCYHDHDDYILRSTPGLYPDPLYPLDPSEGVTALPGQWRAIWITLTVSADAPAGVYPLEALFYDQNGEILGREVFHPEVIPAALPDQTLIHTAWFYTDCLAVWYSVEAFSERHWELIDIYIQSAVAHGINMILTPVFTPPLDTAVGHERPTMQLVGVQKKADTYTFDFAKLDRWVSLCLKRGVKYLEISHLFTQWGAKHAPKIMALEDGQPKKIFGWETEALGEEYRGFLKQFLTALISFFEDRKLRGRVYFHLSDEPGMDHLQQYQAISAFLQPLLRGYPTMDALSNYQFYQSGAVQNPIPSNDEIETFLTHKVPDLWTYYCCGQHKKRVANRFFNMPSARNRIFGTQLYKYDLKGFLHWGFNFWNTSGSLRAVNPYQNTDAGYSFPSGDAFLVYPGPHGPVDSIRYEVLREALQDLRAWQLYESLAGRTRALQFLEKGAKSPITFSVYPREAEWILTKREGLNHAVYLPLPQN